MEHLLLHAVLLVVKWMAMLEKVLDDTHPKFDFDQSPTCACAHERKRENTYIMASIHPCYTDLRKPPIRTCAQTSPRRRKAFWALSECRNRCPSRSSRPWTRFSPRRQLQAQQTAIKKATAMAQKQIFDVCALNQTAALVVHAIATTNPSMVDMPAQLTIQAGVFVPTEEVSVLAPRALLVTGA